MNLKQPHCRLILNSAVCCLFGLAAGCGESADGDFKQYDQLKSASDEELLGPATTGDTGHQADPAATGSDLGAAGDNEQAADSGLAVEAPVPRSPEEDDASPAGQPRNARSMSMAERNAMIAALGGGRQPSIGPDGRVQLNVNNDSAEPREVKLLVKENQFRTVGPQGALRVSYDDIDLLKVLNMEPVTPEAPDLMPGWLKRLDGRRIRIRGFMVPQFQESDIQRFVLARDNQICCFGRDPKPYDVIEVTLRSGHTTDYIQNRPFDVVGVFQISPEVAEEEVYSLYKIDDALIIER